MTETEIIELGTRVTKLKMRLINLKWFQIFSKYKITKEYNKLNEIYMKNLLKGCFNKILHDIEDNKIREFVEKED